MNKMGRPFLKNPSESTAKARIWRAKRKAKAEALGVDVKDLGPREICRDNYWSDSHRKMLYHMAAVCCKLFRKNGVIGLELDDLVAAAWLDSARRDSEVSGCGRFYLQSMIKYVKNYIISLNGQSSSRVVYLEEFENPKYAPFTQTHNHTKQVDSFDEIKYILSLIPRESTREMVRLCYVEGLTKAEISRQFNLTRCSGGSRIERALTKLRKDITERRNHEILGTFDTDNFVDSELFPVETVKKAG